MGRCSIAGLYYHRVFSLAPGSLFERAWMAIVDVVLAEDAHGLFLSRVSSHAVNSPPSFRIAAGWIFLKSCLKVVEASKILVGGFFTPLKNMTNRQLG